MKPEDEEGQELKLDCIYEAHHLRLEFHMAKIYGQN